MRSRKLITRNLAENLQPLEYRGIDAAFIVAFTSLTEIVFSENGVLSDTIDTLYTFFAVKTPIFRHFYVYFESKNPEISNICTSFSQYLKISG